MVDGNEDMQQGQLAQSLTGRNLREVIIEKHGRQATVILNLSETPIDGIWCSSNLLVSAAGYLTLEDLIPHTNHRGLFIDLFFEMAFGTNMPRILCPSMR
jgi:hypothetical protein